MNAPSQELMNLKKQAFAYATAINLLEAQGLTDWAVTMVPRLKGELAKVDATIKELEAKV